MLLWKDQGFSLVRHVLITVGLIGPALLLAIVVSKPPSALLHSVAHLLLLLLVCFGRRHPVSASCSVCWAQRAASSCAVSSAGHAVIARFSRVAAPRSFRCDPDSGVREDLSRRADDRSGNLGPVHPACGSAQCPARCLCLSQRYGLFALLGACIIIGAISIVQNVQSIVNGDSS
jgi:hypothetical protein